MKTPEEMAIDYTHLNKIVREWGTPEQLKELRGIFKHEDEIWPEGYVQLWIPNDFNYYAICMGYKGQDENGNSVLVAGFRNPFGDDIGAHLPGNEYKYWCELPNLSEEMKKLKEEMLESGMPPQYVYPGKTK